jgi:hypothetical protein
MEMTIKRAGHQDTRVCYNPGDKMTLWTGARDELSAVVAKAHCAHCNEPLNPQQRLILHTGTIDDEGQEIIDAYCRMSCLVDDHYGDGSVTALWQMKEEAECRI